MESWREELYSELYHHGIKGQRWGVRRFQNPDGTLTPEGKIRYDFKREVDILGKKVRDPSHKDDYSMKDIPADLEEVKKRGDLTTSEAKRCIDIANSVYERAKKAEPEITKDVLEYGSLMNGLDHSLKERTSLAAKIGADAKSNGESFETAASNINDSIRYTMIGAADNLVDKYEGFVNYLSRKGYSVQGVKNYFQKYKEGKVKHKALNAVFHSPNGVNFEVQFHTIESLVARMQKVPLYNEARSKNISPERKQSIERAMTLLAEMVNDPQNIERIK